MSSQSKRWRSQGEKAGYKQAETMFKEDKKLANRYVKLARKIGMKYQVPIPKEFKKKYCKHRHSYLVQGKNLKTRLKNGKLIYHCQECKKVMRFPYKK